MCMSTIHNHEACWWSILQSGRGFLRRARGFIMDNNSKKTGLSLLAIMSWISRTPMTLACSCTTEAVDKASIYPDLPPSLPPCLLDPGRDQCATWSECWLHREWHHGHQSANGTDSTSTWPLILTLVTSNCHLDLWLLEVPGFELDNLCMQGVQRVERGLWRVG